MVKLLHLVISSKINNIILYMDFVSLNSTGLYYFSIELKIISSFLQSESKFLVSGFFLRGEFRLPFHRIFISKMLRTTDSGTNCLTSCWRSFFKSRELWILKALLANSDLCYLHYLLVP